MKKIKLATLEDVKDFMEVSNSYEGHVDVKCGSIILDGKSTVGMFGLGLSMELNVYMITDDEYECDRFYNEIKRWEV